MAIVSSEQCKYVFGQDELVQIARDQARHMEDMRAAEDEFNNAKTAHKARVSRIEADVSDCTRRVTSGYEMRMVKCLLLKFRPDPDSALIVRTDNGRVMRKRKLDADEKQLKLVTTEPEAWIFEADFYADTTGDVSELVAANVPLTAKEAEELRDAEITLKPTRKQLGSGKPSRK